MSNKPGLTPKGERMPQTPEEFQYMGNLYEEALIERDREISRLKSTINDLRQKLDKLSRYE